MLSEMKQNFLDGKIEKYEYMEKMFDFHKVLYEYAGFVNNSNTVEITIKDGDVFFTFLSNGVFIKMVCIDYDITSVPFTFLDFGSYDKNETETLMKFIKNGDVVLDIGANLGWYTLNCLKKYDVIVFSFEPVLDIYNKLVKNLILNGQPAKNAFNFGLSNINSQENFFFDVERCGATSMVNLRGTDRTKNIICSVKKLDDIFNSLNTNKLDLIKCDVEGAEKLVFEGGLNTIKRYKPIIYTELLRKWAKKFNYHPNDVLLLLGGLGYECYFINQNKLEKLTIVDEDTTQTNFFFFHKDKHAGVCESYM